MFEHVADIFKDITFAIVSGGFGLIPDVLDGVLVGDAKEAARIKHIILKFSTLLQLHVQLLPMAA